MIQNIIDDIKAEELDNYSYNDFIDNITKSVIDSLENDVTQFLTIIQAIKDCGKPCFKRDVLIEVISSIIFSRSSPIPGLFAKLFQNDTRQVKPWKLMANTIASLPDVIAGCDSIRRYPKFKPSNYFMIICTHIGSSLKHINACGSKISFEQKLFFHQILGRAALSGHGRIVWDILIHVSNENDATRQLISNILVIPTSQNTPQSISATLEIFIESLYSPIFIHTELNKNSGQFIRSLISNNILCNDTLEYIVTKKLVFQRSVQLDWNYRLALLFNIFSYLGNLIEDEVNGKRLLVKTFLNIVDVWSDSTRILLRPQEHSVSISLALLMAFRFSIELSSLSLIEHATDIQSKLMRGIQVFMDRTSTDLRNQALCVAELLMPTLHRLVDESRGKEDNLDLKFDYEPNKECLLLKESYNNVGVLMNSESIDSSLFIEKEPTPLSSEPIKPVKEDKSNDLKILVKERANDNIIDCNNDSDDLQPYEDMDSSDSDDSIDVQMVDQDMVNAPIYIRDCIDGLVENNKARYVRLCLVKTNELVKRILEESDHKKSVAVQNQLQSPKNTSTHNDDTMRDYAVELTQLLLYLENTFNIENFDTLRLSGLTSLCLACPDLVAKCLLDEFNGTRRNYRNQLEILQILVATAQEMSGNHVMKLDITNDDEEKLSSIFKGKPRENHGRVNKFSQFGRLYFYGIIDRLKMNVNSDIQPTTVLSAIKSFVKDDETHSFRSRESMLRRVISGITNSRDIIANQSLFGTEVTATNPQQYKPMVTIISEQRSDESKQTKTDKISMNTESEQPDVESSSPSLINDDYLDDGRSLLEKDQSKIDNSFLLTRILFSLSMILRCLHQQPITSGLSNDLLDILAAYKNHPDSGVRRAIVVCLTVIKSSTPSVFFEENLYDKVMSLFHVWLINQSENIYLK